MNCPSAAPGGACVGRKHGDERTSVSRLGPTVILSNGDVVFQPHKVERSGIAEAVDNQIGDLVARDLSRLLPLEVLR